MFFKKIKIFKIDQLVLVYITGFIFIVTLALVVIRMGFIIMYVPQLSDNIEIQASQESFHITGFKKPDLPVKKLDSAFPEFSAFSVLAVDVDSGVILYEKNPEIQVLPASTTKIMTALVAMEAYDINQILSIPQIKTVGQKMNLVLNEQITVRDLLYGLLVASANDAAEVLAYHYPLGGRQGFIARMNQKAKEIGMKDTYFVNPTGLDEIGHLSTARDMVTLSIYAMQNDFFASVVGTKEIIVESVDKKHKHRFSNINQLLGMVEGVLGVKTGWTENAKENLVSYVQRDGRSVSIALLRSNDRFGESEKLIEWIYQNYSWHQSK